MWDGFGFGQGVFGWGLDCEWTRVGVTRLGWDVTVVTTFERMNSLVAPPTRVRRVTVPIPVASTLELSPRVTGLGGLSGRYIVNHIWLQAMCDVAPESMMMSFFLRVSGSVNK